MSRSLTTCSLQAVLTACSLSPVTAHTLGHAVERPIRRRRCLMSWLRPIA